MKQSPRTRRLEDNLLKRTEWYRRRPSTERLCAGLRSLGVVAHVVGDVSGVKLNGSAMGPRAMARRRVRRSVTAFFKSSAVLDSVLPVRTYFRLRLNVPL